MLPSHLSIPFPSSSRYLDLCPNKLSLIKTEAIEKQFFSLSLLKIQITWPDTWILLEMHFNIFYRCHCFVMLRQFTIGFFYCDFIPGFFSSNALYMKRWFIQFTYKYIAIELWTVSNTDPLFNFFCSAQTLKYVQDKGKSVLL